MEVRLMGSLTVVRDGQDVAVGGPRQQLVLAALALSAGSPVSTERLIELVWDDRPPRTARRTVQSYVSALRTLLEPDVDLIAHAGGYTLDASRQHVDLLLFEDRVTAAIERPAPRAVTELEQALASWESPLALIDSTSGIAARLAPFHELRLHAIDALVAAQIDTGRAADAVARLERLVREHPTRENLWLQLARGLAELGRRDDALRALHRCREQLREQLGLEPSEAMQRFELELLGAPVDADHSRSPGAERTASLPGGRVTFIFTDIEGSTRLLRSLGDRYDVVLDEHRDILRAAWGAHRGHEVNVEGDGCFVAFADTAAAVAACIDAQAGLDAHGWPDDHDVRVRMGIHAGLAYPRNGDYTALTVHRAARIGAAAYGQQVLITGDAAEAVPAPLDARLHPLGRFRVADFDDPVDLFGVETGASEMHRHAPRLVPADGHNLTAPPGAFVARAEELERIPTLLGPAQIVTITGSGGVGKTRLAIELGLGLAAAERFPDGVWMAELDALDDGASIDATVLDAIGGSVSGSTAPWKGVIEHLNDQRALLVIDNCEHLIETCAERLADVLRRCPTVSVLVTSRVPLGLIGERVVRLRPLPSTSDDAQPSDAVALFTERAPRSLDDTSARTAQDIEDLCAEVDGLPLAIEMVASLTDTMSPNDIRQALRRRSRAVSLGDPRVPDRQRTLARLLDWSYQLLDPDERAALRRLTVFSDGFDTGTAAAAISDHGGGDVDEAAELIWSLASRSLVSVEPDAGSSRYRLLRTIRSSASAYLGETERIDAVRRLATAFESRIGPDHVADRRWVGDLSLELNNIRSLILVEGIDERLRQRLAWSVVHFHDLTDRFAAGIETCHRFLDALPGETPERGALLTALADLQLRVGDLGGAAAAIDAAAQLADRTGPAAWDDAGVHRTRSDLAMRAGRHDEARDIIEAALESDLSARGRARLLDVLGLSLGSTGDYDGADAAFREEVDVWTELGDDGWAATTLGNLAEVAIRRDHVDEAARHQLACLDVARMLGQPLLIAFSIVMAAQISARRDRWRDAVALQLTADVALADVGYVMFETDEQARIELLQAAREHPSLADAADRLTALPLEVAIELAASTLEFATQQEESPCP